MKYKLLTVVLCLFGLPLLCNAGHAQGTSFDLTGVSNSAGGVWDVTVTQTGTDAWNIYVKADSTTPPIATGEAVLVTFLTKSNVDIGVQSVGAGGTTPGDAWNPSIPHGGITASWAAPTVPPSAWLQINGSDSFMGSEVIDAPAYSVDVRVYDSLAENMWDGSDNVTPEASSLALILPGLIPVGLVLRKRRRRDPDTS